VRILLISLWCVAVAYVIIGNAVLYAQLRRHNVPLSASHVPLPGYLSSRCRAESRNLGPALALFVWTVDVAFFAAVILSVVLANGRMV
jgi:hypothetical protein